MLKLKYGELRNADSKQLPSFRDVGFRIFSEAEEDGILLFIFSILGTTNKKAIEICAGDGRGMLTNLILNHGWEGLMFEGNEDNVKKGKQFFNSHPDSYAMPPKFFQAWITAENINNLIKKNGFEEEIDLLSLDIDGNDYWIWQAIDCIKPRVFICETHNIIPSNLSLTIPYDPNFYCWDKPKNQLYFRSVSLLAMKKLCEQKGYRLIGTHKWGYNCIFMRNDIGIKQFPEVSVESCHDNPFTRYVQAEIWPQVKDMNWIEI